MSLNEFTILQWNWKYKGITVSYYCTPSLHEYLTLKIKYVKDRDYFRPYLIPEKIVQRHWIRPSLTLTQKKIVQGHCTLSTDEHSIDDVKPPDHDFKLG